MYEKILEKMNTLHICIRENEFIGVIRPPFLIVITNYLFNF